MLSPPTSNPQLFDVLLFGVGPGSDGATALRSKRERRCRQTFWQGGQYSIAMVRLSDRLSQLRLPAGRTAQSSQGLARQH